MTHDVGPVPEYLSLPFQASNLAALMEVDRPPSDPSLGAKFPRNDTQISPSEK